MDFKDFIIGERKTSNHFRTASTPAIKERYSKHNTLKIMNEEELKKLHPGQVLYLLNYPVTLNGITSAGVSAKDDQAEGSDGNWCYFPAKYIATEPIDPENGIKNTETAPKYDPNRLFCKGDKVRLVQCNGRNPFDSFNGIEYPPDETIYTADGDEYDNGKVELYSMDSCDVFEIHHSNLELVTPVEELEPYFVAPSSITDAWRIVDTRIGATVATIFKAHPHAKAAAEAERDRLNAEWRKEMGGE